MSLLLDLRLYADTYSWLHNMQLMMSVTGGESSILLSKNIIDEVIMTVTANTTWRSACLVLVLDVRTLIT